MEDTSYLDELDTIHPEEIASRICGTDLHAAISNGDFKKFEALIKDGAPMEAKNTHGLTALQVVCNNQDVNMVTTLLRVGCQVNAKSSVTGKTALALAAYSGNMDIFEMLINHGANVDSQDNCGWTILHEAILGRSAEIIQFVLKMRPAMKYKPNKDGRTPFHLAAFCNVSEDILRLLFAPEDLFILPQYKDANGRSILKMAELHSTADWGDLLEELGELKTGDSNSEDSENTSNS